MILRDRDANTNWEAQADATLEQRTYTCQNWRADVVALMTSGGVLVNQVRYDPYGKPFGIAKTDLDADGDVDGTDASLFATYHFASTMPYADWNWDGTKDLSDQSAFTSDYNADTGIGRGGLGYAYSHANGASRKGYAGYEVDPVLTGSEGWESVYHIRHRVLLSQLGRWTRRDPLGYVDLPSLYLYSSCLLLTITDPCGLAKEVGSGSGDAGDQVLAVPPWVIVACVLCLTMEVPACDGLCANWAPLGYASYMDCMIDCIASGPCALMCVGGPVLVKWIMKWSKSRKKKDDDTSDPPPDPPNLGGFVWSSSAMGSGCSSSTCIGTTKVIGRRHERQRCT